MLPIKIFWFLWNWWFKLSDKIRFVLVGGFNATVQYVLYVLLLWWWGNSFYQAALVTSWIVSTFSSFTTQKIFVFCTKGNWQEWIKEYVKCLGIWVVAYIINAFVLWLLVDFAKINPYGAQIIAVACTTVTSYILMKYFAFNHKKSLIK